MFRTTETYRLFMEKVKAIRNELMRGGGKKQPRMRPRDRTRININIYCGR
jgi:hypothetical protein